MVVNNDLQDFRCLALVAKLVSVILMNSVWHVYIYFLSTAN